VRCVVAVTNAAHAASLEDFGSTRVHTAQASVCWRAQSTVDSLFFIDVPTNPGSRSFCARPVPGTAGAGPQPMVSIALNSVPQDSPGKS